jgi:hypothetical protein
VSGTGLELWVELVTMKSCLSFKQRQSDWSGVESR